jgi:PAS domain S-box-containing protein
VPFKEILNYESAKESKVHRGGAEWIVDYYYRILFFVAIPVALLVFYRSVIGDLPTQFLILSVLIMVIPAARLFLGSLALETKALMLVSILVIATLTVYLYQGLISVGPILSVITIFLTLQIFGDRVFNLAYGIILVVLCAVAFLHYLDWFPEPQNLSNTITLIGKFSTTLFLITLFIFGVRGVFQRLNQQALSEQANFQLAEQTASELVQFIDTANAPIFGIDANGLINVWNQKIAVITGFSKKETIGRELVRLFITDEHKAKVSEVLDLALVGQETENYELLIYCKDGTKTLFLMNATTRRDKNGCIVGVVGVGQNITFMRGQGTALINRQRLDSIGRLTGVIAHDFNNLLTVIQGNLSFMGDEIQNQSEELKEFIEEALTATKQGARLSRQLLTFARERPLKPCNFDVNSVIDRAMLQISENFGKELKILLHLSDKELLVTSDPNQLENVVVNICINAQNSMGLDSLLTVRTHVECFTGRFSNQLDIVDGNYVVITVEDVGCGIPEHLLEKVVEPFFTTSLTGISPGLGLTVAHAYAKNVNGALSIKSVENIGTTVSIIIPQFDPSLSAQ